MIFFAGLLLVALALWQLEQARSGIAKRNMDIDRKSVV